MPPTPSHPATTDRGCQFGLGLRRWDHRVSAWHAAGRAFTLIELLVVVGIIGLLVGILVPSLVAARRASEKTICASNLRQLGIGLQNYVTESRGVLPYVEEPLWRSKSTAGQLDWNADPTDAAFSFSYHNVMRRHIGDWKVLVCPSALVGYPTGAYRTTYRFSAANNFDGVPQRMEQILFAPNPAYAINPINFNVKYLNGRKYKVSYADPFTARIEKGLGVYYLARDFILEGANNTYRKPHAGTKFLFAGNQRLGSFNQLRIDFSVTNESSKESEQIGAAP